MDNSYSSLYPLIGGDLPDNSFSEIPYEKGFQLLWYIESLVNDGTTDYMQDLLRKWILKYSEKSATYFDFKNHVENYVDTNLTAKAAQIKAAIDWKAWVEKPGNIPVFLDFTTTDLNASKALADDYVARQGQSSPADYTKFNDYYSNLKVVFIEELIAKNDTKTKDIMIRVDGDYKLTQTVDPEIKQRWFPLGIMFGYTQVMDPAHQFISSMGRMKYLKPIYQALLDSGNRNTAIQWYNENINFYHPYAVYQLGKMLGVSEAP